MKKILALIALVAFTITVSAQSYTVWPATTNIVKGQASIITGLADNTTTNIPQSVSKSVPLYPNPDGSFANTGIFVAVTGTNAGATNVFTLTFRPEYANPGGTNLSTVQSQTITIMGGGAGTTALCTNVASPTFTAASAWRLTSIAVADDAGSFGGYTVRVGGVGWQR